MQERKELTATDVLEMVREALEAPAAPRPSILRAHLARARELQRTFRSEPVGGKLVPLKRIFYWFTASSFDRQAKAIEALLDAVEELVDEVEKAVAARPEPAEDPHE